jgi:hypothetical protein
MTKHTPGPWQAKAFSSPPGTYFISDSMGQLLFGAGKPLNMQNARLIAAAPTLLALLIDLRDEMKPGPGSGGNDYHDAWQVFGEQIEAAIIKASS